MTTKTFKPASLILGFTAATTILTILSIIVRAKFDIRVLFNPTMIVYEIGFEAFLLILTAALTFFIAKRFNNFTLRMATITAFIFALSYMFISALFTFILYQYFDIFSFFISYFRSGINDGILFILMWLLFKQQKINEIP